jgi:fructokinase
VAGNPNAARRQPRPRRSARPAAGPVAGPAEILCVGEVLWDALPAGRCHGGAPFNVAAHVRAAGLPVALVSRVGEDQLGDEVRRRAARLGVGIDLLQTDPTLPTGLVRVEVDDAGKATFDIVAPAAWDAIALTDALLLRAADARAIVFGTLAQRHATSRATIARLTAGPALRVLDANLRPPYDDREIVRHSLERADVVKVSDDELERMAEWFGFAGPQRELAGALAESFGCAVVCVTRGPRGAALWREGRWSEQEGYEVEVRDTVGAGDAFLAVLLAGLLAGGDDRAILQHANMMGAYVATQHGAVPVDQPTRTR